MRRAGRPRRGWRAWGRSAGVPAAPTGRRRPRARGRSRSCTWRAGSRKLASGVALSTFLFDLDGTLIDSIELILRSYRHTMRLHRGHEPPDDVWMTGLGTPLSVQFRHFTDRSEEHTSELQYGYISYAVFCLKKKNQKPPSIRYTSHQAT